MNRRLRLIYVLCGLILAVALAARLAKHIPVLQDRSVLEIARLRYDYLRDMALVFVTMVAAYLANVFQMRTKFVAALEEEWRAMVQTKRKLVEFCERNDTTLNDFLAAYGRISATLDNMRIVYRNVGETDTLIGLYPYSPLHDRRRALETLDPRQGGTSSVEQRRVVCAAIEQSFTALRETFLEELDLEEPTHGQLVSGARRTKTPGATRRARRRQQRQFAKRAKGSSDAAVDERLAAAYDRERAQERPER